MLAYTWTGTLLRYPPEIDSFPTSVQGPRSLNSYCGAMHQNAEFVHRERESGSSCESKLRDDTKEIGAHLADYQCWGVATPSRPSL